MADAGRSVSPTTPPDDAHLAEGVAGVNASAPPPVLHVFRPSLEPMAVAPRATRPGALTVLAYIEVFISVAALIIALWRLTTRGHYVWRLPKQIDPTTVALAQIEHFLSVVMNVLLLGCALLILADLRQGREVQRLWAIAQFAVAAFGMVIAFKLGSALETLPPARGPFASSALTPDEVTFRGVFENFLGCACPVYILVVLSGQRAMDWYDHLSDRARRAIEEPQESR